MKRHVLGAIAALSTVVTGAVGPAGPAAVADPPLSSTNVELVATIPTGVGVGGKFMGNHYFQTTARAGSFLPGGASTGGLVVLDVSAPELPRPAGFLPLPIWQNEDVDVSAKRNLVLISMDRRKSVSQVATSPIIGGVLFVIDVANRNAPVLKSTLQLPAEVAKTDGGVPLGGPGHVANCILDCNYVYLTGSRDRSVWVVDLRNAAAPAILGKVATPAGADSEAWDPNGPGVVHDVNVDPTGHVWMTGSGGTALYAPIKDPMKPKLLASVKASDNERLNQLIHHGSLRVEKDVVYVGEEDLSTGDCGGKDGEEGPQDGSFQTWRIDLRAKRLVPLDTWDLVYDNANDRSVRGQFGCSSHWFDVNQHKVVADAWYGGGVRFLDVSNPRNIRPVGWWMPPNTAAGQAQFVPGRPDLVYVSDYDRGLDVIKIDNGGKGAPTVTGPAPVVRDEPLRFEPHPTFGYACAVPVI